MQTLVQLNATISKTDHHCTRHRQAAYERAGSIDKMTELLVEESFRKITEARMADWPTR